MNEFKIIDNYENYEISRDGVVRNVLTKKVLIPYLLQGYYTVRLTKDKKKIRLGLHRLIAISFIPNPENKAQVDHIDNNKTNNNIDNLRWAKFEENQRNKGLQRNNTSGLKGVCWKKDRKKWVSYITIDGIKVTLGYFNSKEEAHEKRIAAANECF